MKVTKKINLSFLKIKSESKITTFWQIITGKNKTPNQDLIFRSDILSENGVEFLDLDTII
jgi:hypothetical protein